VVDNEYYVNDAGRQMDILATSVYLRYLGTDTFPDNGYKGDYIFDIAEILTLFLINPSTNIYMCA
jgi:arginyl-tRNA synthetase